MDAPPQPWGLGLRPRIMAPPASFVCFFPACLHPASPVANGATAQLNAGEPLSNISWRDNLDVPRPIHRLPAWHRIPVASFSGTNGTDSTRTIMKRVFQPNPRFAKLLALQIQCKLAAAAKQAAILATIDRLELPDAKSRKVDSFKASDALPEFSGVPQSPAEMAQVYMTAKVDVVNATLQIPRALLRQEVLTLRSLKRTRGVAPMKRSIDKNYCIEDDGLYGGYRIETYDLLHPLILKAAKSAGKPIDVLTASVAEISANFARSGRRNPRRLISLQGVPTLPVIIDEPELKDEVSLVLPSGESAVDLKSPVKRSSQPVEPLKETPRRLSDTVVKLVPAISPTIEPSPVKSSPASSSPLVTTPSQHGGVTVKPVVSTSPGPTLTFRAPSYDDDETDDDDDDFSSTILSQGMADASACKTPQPGSPIKTPNPLHTPSPIKQTPSVTPGCANTSALGLVASIPAAATPKQDVPSFLPGWPSDSAQIDFGPVAPSFDSSNWLSDDIATRRKTAMKKAHRRRSEPLVRNHKDQAARRQTMSPSRLVFQSHAMFDASETPRPSTPEAAELEHTSWQNDPKSETGGLVRTPEHSAPSESNLNFVTPAISWGRMTGRLSGDEVTPVRIWTAPPTGVHNVDMRQHQDIFGAPTISPTGSTPARSSPAVDTLAGIAHDRCDGEALVGVTEEDGRLIVRFKLPTEFGHLFPNPQGENVPHSTVAASSVSPSPRINSAGSAGNNVAPHTPAFESHAVQGEDHTLVMSDFSTSPVAQLATTSPSPSPLLHTPSISRPCSAPSSAQAKRATPSEQVDSAAAENTGVSISADHNDLDVDMIDAEPMEVDMDQGMAEQGQAALEQQPFDDSPGRDYMRDFIKRTSRQRRSATEAGSPIAPLTTRIPLGTKSSNTPSPRKVKRKAESDVPDVEPDTDSTSGPVRKRARLSDALGSHEPSKDTESRKRKAESDVSGAEPDTHSTSAPVPKRARRSAKAVEGQEHKAEMATGDGNGTRRSTRLRSQKPTPGATAKSAIPTAAPTTIKVGPRRGRVVLNSTTRTDQHDLSHQTRMNTRKNKGNAALPSQVLAKYQGEEVGEGSSDSGPAGNSSSDGKNVGWKTPLEVHAEEKPKRARMAKATNPATAAQKQKRTAKVAAALGMSQNGTPARPTRVTRSSTRTRQV
ncbi:hypothetical protein E4U32_006755 [Claviceps aff. humidiphila group G2b]|nr:hypothetical protein E4U32_006755 [Claviceps aff. humidiphila group G2b]